jgi:hypothetical protein
LYEIIRFVFDLIRFCRFKRHIHKQLQTCGYSQGATNTPAIGILIPTAAEAAVGTYRQPSG